MDTEFVRAENEDARERSSSPTALPYEKKAPKPPRRQQGAAPSRAPAARNGAIDETVESVHSTQLDPVYDPKDIGTLGTFKRNDLKRSKIDEQLHVPLEKFDQPASPKYTPHSSLGSSTGQPSSPPMGASPPPTAFASPSRAYHPGHASFKKTVHLAAVGGLKENLTTVFKELPKDTISGLAKAGERLVQLKVRINELAARRGGGASATPARPSKGKLFAGNKSAKVARAVKECLEQINALRANFHAFPGWLTYEEQLRIDSAVFSEGIDRSLLHGPL